MRITGISLIIVSVMMLLGVIVFALFGQPLFFDLSAATNQIDTLQHKKGDTIRPLEKFNFNTGNWTAYLIISRSDKGDLSDDMPDGNVLKTTDKLLLVQMKNKWKFKYTGGDVATVESSIIICCDGKPVFRSGIVLDELTQGLQSGAYGWLEVPHDLRLTAECKQFKRVYYPVFIW